MFSKKSDSTPRRHLVLKEWENCKNKIASLKSKHQEMAKQMQQIEELKIHLEYLIRNKELAKEALEAYQTFTKNNFSGDLFAGNFPRFGRGREEAYEEEWWEKEQILNMLKLLIEKL